MLEKNTNFIGETFEELVSAWDSDYAKLKDLVDTFNKAVREDRKPDKDAFKAKAQAQVELMNKSAQLYWLKGLADIEAVIRKRSFRTVKVSISDKTGYAETKTTSKNGDDIIAYFDPETVMKYFKVSHDTRMKIARLLSIAGYLAARDDLKYKGKDLTSMFPSENMQTLMKDGGKALSKTYIAKLEQEVFNGLGINFKAMNNDPMLGYLKLATTKEKRGGGIVMLSLSKSIGAFMNAVYFSINGVQDENGKWVSAPYTFKPFSYEEAETVRFNELSEEEKAAETTPTEEAKSEEAAA